MIQGYSVQEVIRAVEPVHYEQSIENTLATWKQNMAAEPWSCHMARYRHTGCGIHYSSTIQRLYMTTYVYKVQKKQALAVRPKVLCYWVYTHHHRLKVLFGRRLAIVELQKVDCITKVWKLTNPSNRLDCLTNIKGAFGKSPFYNNK